MPPKNEHQPSGGVDKTPLEPASKSYTVRFTFHRATNVPVADMRTRSSDPYLMVQLNTSQSKRNEHDPLHRLRTKTVYRTTEPKWETTWTVAGIPADGFTLKVRLMDEDSPDRDDKLGKVQLHSGKIDEGYKLSEQEFEVRKKGSDVRAYALRWCTSALMPRKQLHARLYISVEVLGQTEQRMGKSYTLSTYWWMHYSPLIGRLAGTKTNDDKGIERSNFQANQIQLQGPVPNELYHRYVDFKPFVSWMFHGSGLRGRILNKALHHQHARIYKYDTNTKYGELDGPGEDMALRFLDLVHYDQGGRLFTYVITLDGMFRFTETGKEFGIDLLSKHTMHSDVNIYIAYSGEFLVRRLANPDKSSKSPDQHTHPAENLENGPPDEEPPHDPTHYELVIDNDSGTYRPDKELLPILQKFLESNFTGLHVRAMACDDDELDKIKKRQLKAKEEEGDHMVFGQQSDTSSISSSEASDLEERAAQENAEAPTGTTEKFVNALEKPKEVVQNSLPGKGKRERKHREKEADEREARHEGKVEEKVR